MRVMDILVWIVSLALYTTLCICQKNEEFVNNSTDPDKDMYVIHAMVYQVGIISNKSDDNTHNATMGNQEAITLYHTNGSNIDLSKITAPIVTNVTAQSLIGVAPTSDHNLETQQFPWPAVRALVQQKKGLSGISGAAQWTNDENDKNHIAAGATSDRSTKKVKRSLDDTFKVLFKRDVTTEENNSVKIMRGKVEIPKEAKVQSLALPPLIALNNNFSQIPVPIPNTSVVHYAKINTLVQGP